MQSSLPSRLHVAIIMDGNGRWANRRGLPRHAGHVAGVKAVRRVVKAAPDLGIGTLSLYAFSSDNWRRPETEIDGLFRLLRAYLRSEVSTLCENQVRLTAIGRRDRLPDGIADEIARAEAMTAGGRRLNLRVALDYSARDTILKAVGDAARGAANPVRLTHKAFSALLGGGDPAPDVDLLIRTSGEQRLSDFLLWECAYAELCFTPCLWPDFGPEALAEALHDFHGRQRRFGGLGDDTAALAAKPAAIAPPRVRRVAAGGRR